jgi:hypothetical protein
VSISKQCPQIHVPFEREIERTPRSKKKQKQSSITDLKNDIAETLSDREFWISNHSYTFNFTTFRKQWPQFFILHIFKSNEERKV